MISLEKLKEWRPLIIRGTFFPTTNREVELIDSHVTAYNKLLAVCDLANRSSWQDCGETPQKFHNFLLEIISITGDPDLGTL